MLDISNPEGTAENGSGNETQQQDGSGIPKGITENAPYAIPNIQWDYNKWNIREDSKPYLNYVAKLLKDNPSIKVEIKFPL